jgi:hypothetical protein
MFSPRFAEIITGSFSQTERMTVTLILVSILFVVLAIPIAVYIMVVERTWNFHRLWELALRGHRLARIYMAFVVLAFAIAVIACVFAFQAERVAKDRRSAAPHHAVQLNASGDH